MRRTLFLLLALIGESSIAHGIEATSGGLVLPTVPVAFRLPERAAISPLGPDGAPLMDAYRIQATPSGCAERDLNVTRAYADTGEIRLDPRCDWAVRLTLGAAFETGYGLRESYYESPAFFLRQADLTGKVKLDVSFQWRRQEAGAARGFKAAKLFLD